MSTVLGQWRATYTPGDWVLLSGPTSLVLLEPPPECSTMLGTLWEEVVASSSMSDLAGRLASFGFDSLPSFAAFFWTDDGMRSLVRGQVSVVDLASGVTVAQGDGIQTWSEIGLQHVTQVQVETQSSNEAQLELPLIVGAVRASAVRLDASPAARVSSPQRPVEPEAAPAFAVPAEVLPARRQAADAQPADGTSAAAAPVVDAPAVSVPVFSAPVFSAPVAGSPVGEAPAVGMPVARAPGDVPAAGAPGDVVPAGVAPAAEMPPGGVTAGEAPAGVAPVGEAPVALEPAPAPAELPAAQPVQAQDAGPDTELLADPFADDLEPQPVAPEPAPVPAFTQPMPEPEATDPAPPRRMAPEPEVENADTELMPPAYAAAPPPTLQMSPPTASQSGPSDNSLIMAVVCPYGHANPQNATHCRTCDSPIAPQGPQLVPRPILAVLRSTDGTTAEVDRAVLIGRAPSAQRSTARSPRLMTLPSPGHDISRTHVEVAPEGWQIVVTDLHSTNGTVLVHPGGRNEQLVPGETRQVQLGSVMELGDGISVLIDFPQ